MTTKRKARQTDNLQPYVFKGDEHHEYLWINNHRYLIIFKPVEGNEYDWKYRFLCAHSVDEVQWETIRLGQTVIHRARCCDSMYAELLPYSGNPPQPLPKPVYGRIFECGQWGDAARPGAIVRPVLRCSMWSEDGDEFIQLW